jgi:hypothetical protein
MPLIPVVLVLFVMGPLKPLPEFQNVQEYPSGLSLRRRRQHKAWGEVKRNPRVITTIERSP